MTCVCVCVSVCVSMVCVRECVNVSLSMRVCVSPHSAALCSLSVVLPALAPLPLTPSVSPAARGSPDDSQRGHYGDAPPAPEAPPPHAARSRWLRPLLRSNRRCPPRPPAPFLHPDHKTNTESFTKPLFLPERFSNTVCTLLYENEAG